MRKLTNLSNIGLLRKQEAVITICIGRQQRREYSRSFSKQIWCFNSCSTVVSGGHSF